MIVESIANVLLIISAIINLEMIVRYHRITRGAWRDTVMGRHVMAYMATTGLILGLASVRLIVVNWLDQSDPLWFQVLRVITFLTLPAIFLWRRHLIIQAHTGTKEK